MAIVAMTVPFNTQFSSLQQQRFDEALDNYWKEPAHAKFKNDPRFKDESVLFATWHARANVMSDIEFNAITVGLFELALESGDLGYAYYSRIIAKLRELR